MRVAGGLDEDAVAGGEDRPAQQSDGVLGAERHEDLVGGRRQAAGGVAVGDGGPQRRDAEEFVPVPGQVAEQVLRGVAGGVGDDGGRGEHGTGEVHQPAGDGERFGRSGRGGGGAG